MSWLFTSSSFPLSRWDMTLAAVQRFWSKRNMGRPKFLGRIPKAGTGRNRSRKRAQVSQHWSRVNEMPNSEASPRAPATATPTVSYQSPPHVVSRSVTAKRAHMTRKIIVPPQRLSYNKSVGILKIAEVCSWFESSNKKDKLEEFVLVSDKLGFKCLKTDQTNKMFVMLECKKTGKKPKADLRLQPSHVFTREDDGT